jgi:hypothetical protein
MNYDNPAVRLLSLIEQGKKEDPSQSCRIVWQKLLKADNLQLLLPRLGKVMELSELIIEEIKENYPKQDRNCWSHWETQVNHAFMNQNLNGQWVTFINHIDQHSITYLHLASDLLQAKSNTKSLTDENLLTISEQLNTIYQEVLESDLSDEVRTYLIKNLRKLILSIDEYKLTGAPPILEAIGTAIGHAHLDEEYKNFLTDTELGKKLLDTLASMANVVTVAVGLPQLTQAIALLTN